MLMNILGLKAWLKAKSKQIIKTLMDKQKIEKRVTLNYLRAMRTKMDEKGCKAVILNHDIAAVECEKRL